LAKGLVVKKPHDKAPEWVIGSLSFKVDEFIPFLKEHANNGWLNLDIKDGKKGYYAEINTWKPENKQENKPVQEYTEMHNGETDDLPF
jgi:hypothetical protein